MQFLRYLGKYRDTKLTVYSSATIPLVSWDDFSMKFESLYCWQRLHTAMMKSSHSKANFYRYML